MYINLQVLRKRDAFTCVMLKTACLSRKFARIYGGITDGRDLKTEMNVQVQVQWRKKEQNITMYPSELIRDSWHRITLTAWSRVRL